MARKETVVFTCDLHDDEFSENVETVSFGLDGNTYELDVCEQHRSEMQDAFARYVGAARKATGSGGGSGARRSGRTASRSTSSGSGSGGSGGGGADREEVQRIREWAREHGHKVSERGRLSSSVLEAYRAAH